MVESQTEITETGVGVDSDEAFSAYRDSDTVVQNTKKGYLSKYYNFT